MRAEELSEVFAAKGRGAKKDFRRGWPLLARSTSKGSLLMSMTLTLCAVGQASAAEDDKLEEVIVRATSVGMKTETSILLIPQSVQVIPLEVMQDQMSQGVTDVVENVSGIQPWFGYGGSYDIFVIRGFLTSAANFRNGNRVPASKFDLANVARVEVLKGPSSVLYGSSDPGGLVNTVTKTPTMSPSFSIEQQFGSYGRFRTEASASGPLNEEQALLGRVDASYLTGETFRQQSDNERVFVAPAVSWDLGSSTRINLSYEYMNDKLVYDGGVPAVGDRIADIPVKRAFATSGEQDVHETHLVDANLSHDFNDSWTLTAGAFSNHSTVDWNLFYGYSQMEFGDELQDTYANYGAEKLTTEIAWTNLAGEFDTGSISHQVLLGAEYNQLDLHTEFIDLYVATNNVFQPGPYNLGADYDLYDTAPRDFVFNQKLKSKAVFFQDEIGLNEKLDLIVGLRYDHIQSDMNTSYYSPIYDVANRTDSKVSPRVGLVYQTDNNLSFYASYIKSFGPSFNYDSFNRYPPAEAKQYEIGAKKEMFGGKLLATLAVYDLIKGNIPTPDPNNPLTTLLIGEAESQGVEIDIQGKVNSTFSVLASYAYDLAEIAKDTAGNQGNRLPYAPRHQGSLSLKVEPQGGALNGASFGGGLFGATKRYGDLDNSYSDGSYVRLDLFAAYQMQLGEKTVTTRVNLNNVTDVEYYTLRARWSNMPVEPRAIYGSVRVQF